MEILRKILMSIKYSMDMLASHAQKLRMDQDSTRRQEWIVKGHKRARRKEIEAMTRMVLVSDSELSSSEGMCIEILAQLLLRMDDE